MSKPTCKAFDVAAWKDGRLPHAGTCLDYYGCPGVRELCHAVKQESDQQLKNEAVQAASEMLAATGIATPDSLLIPAPQHSGKAEYTRQMADAISHMIGAHVLDIVACLPHESHYKQKRASSRQANIQPDFFLSEPLSSVSPNTQLLLIDNVIDTGTTFNGIDKLFEGQLFPFVLGVDYGHLRDEKVRTLALRMHELGRHCPSERPEFCRFRMQGAFAEPSNTFL